MPPIAGAGDDGSDLCLAAPNFAQPHSAQSAGTITRERNNNRMPEDGVSAGWFQVPSWLVFWNGNCEYQPAWRQVCGNGTPPRAESLVRHPFLAMIRFLMRLAACLSALLALAAPGRATGTAPPSFMERVDAFPALEAQRGIHTVWEQIVFRAHDTPFFVVATVIFLLAIIHTFSRRADHPDGQPHAGRAR